MFTFIIGRIIIYIKYLELTRRSYSDKLFLFVLVLK